MGYKMKKKSAKSLRRLNNLNTNFTKLQNKAFQHVLFMLANIDILC